MKGNRWIAWSVGVVVAGGFAAAGVVASRAGQASSTPNAPPVVVENRFDRPVPVRVVNALDQPEQEIPIRVVATALPAVKLDPDTVVKLARPQWEYRELRIPTNPGTTPNAIAALATAGADGWETTGVTFSSPGATVLVMKRMR